MRAIVLVGGAGTRLQPLTHRTPKQLAPVLNRPLLEHLLLHLKANGVQLITLAVTRTPASDAIRSTFSDGHSLGLEIDYAYEETPLGSGGAIAAAARGWTEPFLVCNGDIITDLDISLMVEEHRKRGAELSISLHEVDDPSPFGVVALDSVGRISKFVEKPSRESAPSRLINAGTWLFEPSLLDEMDGTRFNRVEDTLFPQLADTQRSILGFHRPSYWSDVGNPDAYLSVNLDLLGGAIERLLPKHWPDDQVMTCDTTLDDEVIISPPTLVGQGTTIRRSARVDGPTVIGYDCKIENNTQISRSVLWDDVTVHANSTIVDSVLGTAVTIESDATVTGAVVGHGATIGRGQQLPVGAHIDPDPDYTTEKG